MQNLLPPAKVIKQSVPLHAQLERAMLTLASCQNPFLDPVYMQNLLKTRWRYIRECVMLQQLSWMFCFRSCGSMGDVQHKHSRIQTAPMALRLRRLNAFQFFSYSWINTVIFFLLECPVNVATVSWTDKPKGRLKQHSRQSNINTANAERIKHTYVCLVNLCLLPFCLVF